MTKRSPKLPTKSMSKAERQGRILEKIAEHKSMSADTLVAFLIKEDGGNRNALQQKIYRDLKDLVERGLVVERVFTPSGQLIPPNQEKPKNFRAWWELAEGAMVSRPLVPGEGLLALFGAEIDLPESFAKDFLISEDQVQTKEMVCLQLAYNHSSVHISFPKSLLPMRFIIGRWVKTHLDWVPVREIFGRRTVVLSIRAKELSAGKDLTLPGHAIISIEDWDKVAVTDLKSTNGTHYLDLSAVKGGFSNDDYIGRSGQPSDRTVDIVNQVSVFDSGLFQPIRHIQNFAFNAEPIKLCLGKSMFLRISKNE